MIPGPLLRNPTRVWETRCGDHRHRHRLAVIARATAGAVQCGRRTRPSFSEPMIRAHRVTWPATPTREIGGCVGFSRGQCLHDGNCCHTVITKAPTVSRGVIHEAALHMQVGRRQIAREQLKRLIEEGRRENVTLLVIPFSVESFRWQETQYCTQPPKAHIWTPLSGHANRCRLLRLPHTADQLPPPPGRGRTSSLGTQTREGPDPRNRQGSIRGRTLPELKGVTSSFSEASGNNCVEIAQNRHTIVIRDSKNQKLPWVSVGRAVWSRFASAVAEAQLP